MCCGCWENEGAHAIDNARVRAVQPLIEAVYDFHGAGGSLHIVLDDNNLEDDDLAFCGAAIASNDYDFSPEQLAAERACLSALQAMSFDERVSAIGLWDGCW